MQCKKCGQTLPEGSEFCSSCGTRINGAQQQGTGAAQPQFDINKINNTADTTADYDKADIEQNKIYAILAYLGILVLVPLLAAPKSKFARFHANQGIVLCIAEVAYWIIYSILSVVIYAISWKLYFIVTLIGFIALVFVVFAILGIVNAANGKAKELPLIGKISIIK